MAALLNQQGERVALPDTAVRRTPSILQLEAVECGAAALAMILAYHGKHVPLERLRVECGVSRDGSKAGNILRAARAHGLVAKGFRKEPRELAALPLPAVLFWNFNHFVVLEGFRGGQACINDPALGRRRVDAGEFDSAFTGVVLSFEPGPGFVPGGEAPSVRRSLAQYLAGLKPALGFAVFLGLMLVLPGLLLPWLMGRFIDDVLVARMDSLAAPLLLGLAAAALVRTALVWVQGQLLTDTYGAAAQNASARFLGHALSLPMNFYSQRSPGELTARVDLNGRVAETITSDLPQLALDLFTASFFLVLMVRLEPGLALVAVAGLLIELAVWRVLAARTAEISQQLSMRGGKLAGTITGGLANIEGIKAAGQEQALFTKWMGLQVQYVNAVAGAQRLALTLGQAPGLLSLVAHLAVLGLGAVRIVEGSFTVGNLVAFQLLLAGFVSPVHALFAATQQLQSLRGDLARLDDVLHYGKEESVSMQPEPRGELVTALTVEFRDVSFGYDRNAPALLEGISFTLAPAKRVALVGASGSGKSTVGRLAAGLYAPWSGEILFNGKPREAWPRASLAQALCYVDQDVVLFQGTVRDNLTLWDTTIDDARIVAALDDAAIREEILSRGDSTANPLDASLAEGARNLSGGQRQRLEIARALARSPAVLVLDEATSALDFTAEARIGAALRRRGIACLIVAHRLSTVRDADEILVIEGGRVIERGNHASLAAIEGGRYRALVAAEAREDRP